MSENRRIHLRIGTAAEWATFNPVLGLGEPGFESDTKILRIGDGLTAFLSLVGLPMAAVSQLRNIATGSGLTGGGNLSADRTITLTGQALALHNLAVNGIIAKTGAGAVTARTLTGVAPVVVTDGDGVLGNPTIKLGDVTALETVITDLDTAIPTSGAVVDYIDTAVTTLLGTMDTTTGTTVTLSGLNLTKFKALRFVLNGVSADQSINLVLDITQCSGGSGSAAAAFYGTIDLDLATGVFSASIGTPGNNFSTYAGITAFTNASTEVFLIASGGNFDGGSIRVYGLK